MADRLADDDRTIIDRVTEIYEADQNDELTLEDGTPLYEACEQIFDDVDSSDLDWDTIAMESQGAVEEADLIDIGKRSLAAAIDHSLDDFAELSEEQQAARSAEFGGKIQALLEQADNFGIPKEGYTNRLIELNLL